MKHLQSVMAFSNVKTQVRKKPRSRLGRMDAKKTGNYILLLFCPFRPLPGTAVNHCCGRKIENVQNLSNSQSF